MWRDVTMLFSIISRFIARRCSLSGKIAQFQSRNGNDRVSNMSDEDFTSSPKAPENVFDSVQLNLRYVGPFLFLFLNSYMDMTLNLFVNDL